MSDYGVFEASSTDGHEEEQQQRQAQRDLGRAIEAAREAFGDFLASATDKQDYKDRLALVMNDLMQSVADSGVMPVPGVMRKVKAALRPEFRKSTGARAVPYLEAYPDSTATGDEWTIVDESGNPLVKDQGDGGADVPYHFRSEDAAEEAAQKHSRKHADDHLDAPGVDMSQLRLDGLGNYGDAVAVVFDDSGNAVDLALNWETAQSMAQEGYDVQVVRGDGGRSQDEIQRMVDHEKELRRDLFGSRKTASRSLSEIAAEIRADWKNVYFGAEPYLDAMSSLDSIDDSYGQDSASSIVAYFLSNATSWRGETARRVKKELKELSKRRAHKTADQWDDEINRSIDEYLNSSPGGAPKIAPHPEYGEGVWSDEGVRQRVLSLDPNLPTPELVDAIMREMGDFYDSIDRELAFWYFSQVTGRDYDDFYNAWMAIPGDKYFSSRQAAEYDPRIVALSDEELERLLKENPDHEGLQDEAYVRGLDKVDYFAKRKTAELTDEDYDRIIREQSDGFSFRHSPDDGPSTGWMVSLDGPEESFSTITGDDLKEFREKNLHYLSNPDYYIGGWRNSANGLFYLDVSVNIQDREEAIQFGKDQDQIAIINIETWEEIVLKESSLKQAGSAQVLQKLEDALDDQRNVDVICSNSPDGSFSGEREIPVDEGLQKVRGWVSAGDLVDTAQDGGNFFDFEHRASGENVNFYITQEY